MWPVTDQCYAVSISKGRTLTGLGRLSGLKLVLCHQFSASQNIFKSRYKQRTTATSRKAEEILAVDLPHGEPQLDPLRELKNCLREKFNALARERRAKKNMRALLDELRDKISSTKS